MLLDPSLFSSPFRMQPGLRRLEPGQRQLTPNRPGDAILDAKLAVLRDHPTQALCRLPDWDDSHALETLTAQACIDCPEAWVTASQTHISTRQTASLLGWSVSGDTVDGNGRPDIGDCLRSLPPHWRLAGLLCLAFAEDFAVIEAAPGCSGRIPWLAVCLPSHWAPRAKLGQSFAEVHAPVADNQALLGAADALSHLVTGPLRWQRGVWTVTPSGRFDGHPDRQPATHWPDDASADEIGELAWLRTEHQTFMPIAGQAQAVFTILVERRRLSDVLANPQTSREIAQAMHSAIGSMSPAVLEYRRLDGVRDRLLAWLADRASR